MWSEVIKHDAVVSEFKCSTGMSDANKITIWLRGVKDMNNNDVVVCRYIM